MTIPFFAAPRRSFSTQHPATKKYKLSTLRVIVAAAAPVSAELTTQLVEAFPKLQIGQGYGQCLPSASSTHAYPPCVQA